MSIWNSLPQGDGHFAALKQIVKTGQCENVITFNLITSFSLLINKLPIKYFLLLESKSSAQKL